MLRWTRRLAGGAAALVLVGCGSTVQVRSTTAAGTDGLGLPETTGAAAPGAPTAAGTSGRPGYAGTPTGPAAAPAAVGASAGAVGPGGGVAAVPLAAKKPITIGVITSGNAGAFTSSLGLKLTFGDQRAQAKLLADYLNKRGGIAGHKINLAFYDYDTAGGGPGNAQAACASFTEDAHAFAAIGVAGMDDAYHECASKHGMIVASDGDVKSTSFYRRYPTTIEVSDVALERKYRAMVHGLRDMGYFSKGAKVAVAYVDEPNDREAVKGSLKPTLAEIGFPAADEIAINDADPSQYVAQVQSAVLKFSTEGITHVVFGRASAFTFAQAAEKQGYYPKYGIESRQSPALLMQGANSPQTLVNVMGIGYQPVQDVDQARDPGPVTSRQKLCDKIFTEGGQSSSGSRLTYATALYLCDQMFFLKDAFERAADVSIPSFLKGVAGLGTSYQSTLTFATRFSPTQHDGAQGWRPLRYSTECSCFHYAGPLQQFR